jgi:trimeric autotransporter adhesin
MKHLRGLLLSLTGVIVFGSTALTAQQAAPRITQLVNENSLTTLKGNVPPIARAQYDQGAADGSTQLTGVRLIFSRTEEQKTAVDQYLAQLQDKSSPNYHKWLTPEQVGKLYGPADSDIAAIVAWLESHGLTVAKIAPGHTSIAFSGSVAQLESAFHTKIHSFSVNGRQFYSNTTNPKIPQALSSVVNGVAHMNTIRPKPQYTRGQAGRINPETKRPEPLSAAASTVRPNLTVGSGTSSDPYILYMVPGDAATIYNTPNNIFNANYTSGTSYTGSGVTIGLGGDAVIDTSIVQAYRSLFLGDTEAPTVTNLNGVTSTDDSDEAYLDTELAGSMAPNATIHYYTDADDLGIEQMLSDNTVDIFSLSFGACEQDLSTADNELISGWWQTAALQGITVLVSSGDNGSAGCDNPNNVTTATGGMRVSGFASTLYNIAVGGTDFYSLEDSFSTYAGTTTGSSSTYYRTAKSYIPESTWNNSTVSNTTISANAPWSSQGYSSYNNIVAGSGGPSNCSVNSTVDTTSTYTVGTCTSGYDKPSWQRGTGTYDTDGARDIPDVSLMAGSGWDGAVWLVCDGDTSSGYPMNCKKQSDNYYYFDGFGGTSASSPAFASILALVVEKTGGRLGQAAQELYDTYNGSHASDVYHDITVGNISVPCTSGTTNCTKNTAGYYFESGYNTGTGFDLATGMGSVDATALLTYWGTAVGTTSSTVAVTPTTSSINSGDSLTETVSVTGSGVTPTGTITLSSGTYSATQTIGTSPCTGNTSCVFTIGGGKLAAGTDTITATYHGDETYAAGTATATATVTQSTFTLSLSSPSSSVSRGGSTTATITAASSNSYTGTVTLTCTVTTALTSYNSLPTCAISPSTIAMTTGTAGGTSTLTLSTTAASASLASPDLPGRNRAWPGSGFAAGSGAILAVLFFFGVPAGRRNWRNLLGLVVLLAIFGGLSACGSGGSSSNNSSGSSGTTSGTYTVTVKGTGSDASATTASTTFTLTVN